jgi:hypothetical protein
VAATYTITLQGWDAPSGHFVVRQRAPVFRIDAGSADSYFIVGVLVSHIAEVLLMTVLGTEDQEAPEIDEALLLYGLGEIDRRLRDDSWEDVGTDTVRYLKVPQDEVQTIASLAKEKQCDYQLAEGRDLYCVAAGKSDETQIGNIGARFVAPTSRALCAANTIPDARLLCSHLHHPEVVTTLVTTSERVRWLNSAMCDLGRAEIATPAECKAGGHDCWRRFSEPTLISAAVTPPRTLLEALDFLDTSWRLAFEKRPLARLPSATALADLASPVSTREEFQSRMSQLGDTLKSLEVSAELLASGDSFPVEQSVNRMRSALAGRLDPDAMAEAEGALGVLSRATRIRVAFQHHDAASELPAAFAAFGVSYPPRDWGDTWDSVRSQVTAALLLLAERVRALALAEDSAAS